jgi:ribosome recycling factor
VEYYGILVILKSIAQVSTPDGSTLLIHPFGKSRWHCEMWGDAIKVYDKLEKEKKLSADNVKDLSEDI